MQQWCLAAATKERGGGDYHKKLEQAWSHLQVLHHLRRDADKSVLVQFAILGLVQGIQHVARSRSFCLR